MTAPNRLQIGVPLEEFPAGTLNWLIDAVKSLRANGRKPATSSGGPSPRLVVHCRNSTGEDIEPGEILGISGPIFDYDDVPDQVYSAPVVEGVLPDASQHGSRFAVALSYIEQGKVGPALIMGLAWVRVRLENEDDTHCEIETDEVVLKSAGSGVEMIYRSEADESSDEVWALVMLGGGGGGGSSGDVVYALIEEDVDDAEEVPDAEMPNADPYGEPLHLHAFRPTQLDLKYYVLARDGESDADPGYEEGTLTLILATEEVDDESSSEGDVTEYRTRTFYWPDGHGIKVGTYTKAEYESHHDDLDENDSWPPAGTEESDWRRRYRVKADLDSAGRWWLNPRLCKAVPPPSIDQVLGGEES